MRARLAESLAGKDQQLSCPASSPNLSWIISVNSAIFGIATIVGVLQIDLHAVLCDPFWVSTLRHFSRAISVVMSWRKNPSCQGKQHRLFKMNMSPVHGHQFSDDSLEGTHIILSKPSATEPLLAQTIDFPVQRICPAVLLLQQVKVD